MSGCWLIWAMPPVRLGLAGRYSRKMPERPRKRSQSFSWNSPREDGYNSRHLKPPEHFQNCLPLNTAGDASFFRSVSEEGLSELVMAMLRAFLIIKSPPTSVTAKSIAPKFSQAIIAIRVHSALARMTVGGIFATMDSPLGSCYVGLLLALLHTACCHPSKSDCFCFMPLLSLSPPTNAMASLRHTQRAVSTF